MKNQKKQLLKLEMMNHIKKYLLIIIVILAGYEVRAQYLSAEQAVAIALQNNYSIRLSQLNQEILKNNVTLGNAGFLPSLNATANQNNSITNAHQEYLSGQINERDNAKSRSFNAGAQFDWTLFDGFQMFTGYDILKTQLEAGQLETRLEVENTIADVLRVYYNIVQLRQKTKMFEASVALSKARETIADQKLAIGAGSRLELMQTKVDMNSDISQLLNLQDLITAATIDLNVLLARNAADTIVVEDTILLMPPADYNTLKSQMESMNASLQLNQSDVELAMLNLKNIKGRRMPVIGVSAGYNYNDQHSESGFLKSSQTAGLSYGLTARLPIFNGFDLHRQQQNARVGIQSANLRFESYTADLNAQLLSTYSVYSSKLKNLELEIENLETARINFDIANERYRLGELSGLEIREAQQNWLMAQDRLINLIYQARLLEIDLLQLSGKIIP